MSNNRGTEILKLNIPIRLIAVCVTLDWEILRKDTEVGFAASNPALTAGPSRKITDGWDLTRRFLALNPEDENAILEFLNKYGDFKSAIASSWYWATKEAPPRDRGTVERITKDDIARLQDYLRQMLRSGDATLAAPWEAVGRSYSIGFRKTKTGGQAEVSVFGTCPMMLATVQFKLMQGAKFKTCFRKDCRLPFEVTSRHKRRFCSQYCAHITSLRSRRKLQRKAKKVGEKVQTKGR